MTQRSAETFRLDAQHLEFIRMAGAAFDPPSDNKSLTVRTLLTGLRALLMTRRMPRWMADLQEKLTVCADVSECTRDSVAERTSSSENQPRHLDEHAASDATCFMEHEGRMAQGDSYVGAVAVADSQGRLLKRPPRRIRPTTGVRAAFRVSGLADASLFTPFYGLRRTFAIGA